jgi:glutaredoxin
VHRARPVRQDLEGDRLGRVEPKVGLRRLHGLSVGRTADRDGPGAGWETSPVHPDPTAGPARVRLLTRPGCHLCDEARAVVAQVCAELGESYEEVDLDLAGADDPELHRRYTDEVPVTFVDGVQHDFWRVDPARLRRALG